MPYALAMNWQKAPEFVMQAFDAALPPDPAVQRRKMFGYPAGFVNGNMFAGVFQDQIVVRLPEVKRAQLQAAGGQPFAPMGRTMREYLSLPPSFHDDRSTLGRWLTEALLFGLSLPVKEPKPRRAKAKG